MSDTSSIGYDFKIKDPRTASTYASIGTIVEGALPEVKKDKYERKSLNGGSRAKNFSGSFYDGGTLSLKVVYTKAVYPKLLGYVKDPDGYPVEVDLGDGASVTFNGLFESVSQPAAADGGRYESDVSVQVDGDVTFNPGS